jgi:hypothetical protein
MKMSDQTEQVKELIETSRRITEEARLLVEDTRKLTAQLQNTLKEIHKNEIKMSHYLLRRFLAKCEPSWLPTIRERFWSRILAFPGVRPGLLLEEHIHSSQGNRLRKGPQ